MKFRGILFDKDGTLIESDGTWVPFYSKILQRMKNCSVDEADALMKLAGYDPVTQSMRSGSIMAGGTTRQLVDIWWREHSREEQDEILQVIDATPHDVENVVVKPICETPALLQKLGAMGLRLGIATNDSKRSAERHMEFLGVAGFLDVVIGSDCVARAKPAGDMIRHFSKFTGLAPHEIIMIGDNHHDIEEARQGGAGLAVAVLSGNGTADDLQPIADVVLGSVDELPAYLEQFS